MDCLICGSPNCGDDDHHNELLRETPEEMSAKVRDNPPGLELRPFHCPRCSLLSSTWTGLPPTATRAVERVMAFGAEKYKDHESYLTDGRSARVHGSAAMRHVDYWDNDELQDHESGEHPLAHAIARLMMALELELRKEP